MLIGFYLVAPGSGALPYGGTSHRRRHSPGAPHAGGLTPGAPPAPMTGRQCPDGACPKKKLKQDKDTTPAVMRSVERQLLQGLDPNTVVWRRGAHAGICDVRLPGTQKSGLGDDMDSAGYHKTNAQFDPSPDGVAITDVQWLRRRGKSKSTARS